MGDQGYDLWLAEDWYPPLRPPEILKVELLQNEDFTNVDKAARETPESLTENLKELVKHLTNNLNSDLHKLRAICVWLGTQDIRRRQKTQSCKDKNSPKYYLQEACKDAGFIDKLFGKMCRTGRIPCFFVRAMATDASYTIGDDHLKQPSTLALVYVADSWRFVFPMWAFVKIIPNRVTERDVDTSAEIDEFYFLTDPVVMNCICHPIDTKKQLLAKPLTEEMFLALPRFYPSFFLSVWHLISPLMSVIKSEYGLCIISLFCPESVSKLSYKLVFDESHSGRAFPDHYAIILNQTSHIKSVVVRLPVTGTYHLELNDSHGNRTKRLLQFQIYCNRVRSETRPFPPYRENVFGFGEAAVEAGLSEPSHTDGVVLVKSGDEIIIRFKIDGVNISARLVHFTRKSNDLCNHVSVKKENANVTVSVRLPKDDPAPEYSLELDTIENINGKSVSKKQVLNYLLTNDKTLNTVITTKTTKRNLQFYEMICNAVAKDDSTMLAKAVTNIKMAGIKDTMLDQKIQDKEARYERMRNELNAAVREKTFNRLNRTLGSCIGVNLKYTESIQEAKIVLLALCEEEVKKAATENLKERSQCLQKISSTCISEAVKREDWFIDAQEELELDEILDRKNNLQPLTGDSMATVFKRSDDMVDVLRATFILLGESQTNLNTWQNLWAKLKGNKKEELLTSLGSFDDSVLTQEQVEVAEERLKQCDGTFNNDMFIKTLHGWCLDRIKSYSLRKNLISNCLLRPEDHQRE